MCGRFAFYSPRESVQEYFGVEVPFAFEPRYNVAPSQEVMVIRQQANAQPETEMLKWGLVPFWAKDSEIGSRMINARAETVAEKPAFRQAFKQRRCVILADGFYEWHTEDSVRTPYFVSLASGESFAFGGLWETWTSEEAGEVLETTTIVTTEANDYLRQLHHRMPVVIEPGNAARWLGGDMDYLRDYSTSAPTFRAWPVGREVNNTRNDGTGLINPAGDLVENF